MKQQLPKSVEQFQKDHADVWQAFTALGEACHRSGPLDERSRRLVKVALAVGAGLEGGTHSAVRHALASGIPPQELRQVALLAITTAGFPSAMRALTWIDDSLAEQGA